MNVVTVQKPISDIVVKIDAEGRPGPQPDLGLPDAPDQNVKINFL